MRRPSALPIWAQVALLAVLAVFMSQAVAVGVVVLAPDPRPAGVSIASAAEALRGREAQSTDGRAIRRKVTAAAPDRTASTHPLSPIIRNALAERLSVSADRVRVWVDQPPGSRGPVPRLAGARSFVLTRPPNESAPPPPDPPGPAAIPSGAAIADIRVESYLKQRRAEGHTGPITITRGDGDVFRVLTDRLTFAPFSAALRLEDGRWATVSPPRGWLAPWQTRMLLALGISMLLLAPLVWWMARRLTRPIRVFADAAQRLGADPDAEPLKPSGPTEVRTAIDAFNDMQASLRGHVRKRTQTVAAIAHDLRTPLTRLRFRAEQAPEHLRDRMAADIEDMDALIGQALAYVRGEQPPERREPLDFADLARDCAQDFAETGAAVMFQADARLPVQADPAALRRALANLIGNAVKYAGAARVRAFVEADRAVVIVEDDGPGLPTEELEAVFEPFHRAERSRSRETGGAGLGLTIARQAARALGGDVTLENRAGDGLTARLTLPLAG